MKEKHIELNNLNTCFYEAGEENENFPTVLLLHGWGSNSTLFENVATNIARKYKVYALDMPGFGKTARPLKAWEVSNYVDFVIDFCKSVHLGNVILLGHSFGGRVIIKMNVLDNLPFKISKNILVDAAGIKPRKTLKKKLKSIKYKIGKYVIKIFAPLKLEEYRMKYSSADFKAAEGVMRETFVKVIEEDLSTLLPLIKSSTLLIWGEDDTATPISDGEYMEKVIQGSGLVRFKGCGHYSFLDNPVLFNRVINSFLEIQ